MRPARRRWLYALPGLLLAVSAASQRGGDRVIEEAGQKVEVVVTGHQGGESTTVCLESGPAVTQRKKVVVWAGRESARLTTGNGDRGPNCAFFPPDGEVVRIRLEYPRYVVFTSVLAEVEYPRAELRGKTITFRWVKE